MRPDRSEPDGRHAQACIRPWPEGHDGGPPQDAALMLRAGEKNRRSDNTNATSTLRAIGETGQKEARRYRPHMVKKAEIQGGMASQRFRGGEHLLGMTID